MARYWIGGTGNWSDTAHWSLTSGGGGGAVVPTSADDVFIDANSGFGSGGTITFNTGAPCKEFTSTSGHIYTMTGVVFGNYLQVYGSLTFESGITYSTLSGLDFYGTGFHTITTAEIDIGGNGGSIYFGGTGTYTLQDDLTTTTEIYMDNGTFDANDHNVTARDFYFQADIGLTPTVNMGSGTWTGTNVAGDIWYVDEFNGEVVTINCETSTIKSTGEVTNSNVNFTSPGKTYYNLWFANTLVGSSYLTIDVPIDAPNQTPTITFNNIKIDAGLVLKIDKDITLSTTTFTAIGSVDNLITLDRLNGLASDQFTLSKASGTVECDYLNISNSNATGGATWYAGSHSADTANNDGWIFTDAPSTNAQRRAGKTTRNWFWEK